MPFSYTSSIDFILPLATSEPKVVRGFHSARCSCCCLYDALDIFDQLAYIPDRFRRIIIIYHLFFYAPHTHTQFFSFCYFIAVLSFFPYFLFSSLLILLALLL